MKARNIQRILYALLIIVCIALYTYEVMVSHVPPTKNLARTIILIIGCVLGLISGESRGRKSLDIYEKGQKNIMR